MAGCISCVILPLLLFLFHRFIQPLILKFWNPWATKEDKQIEGKNGMSCPLNRCKDQPKLEEINGTDTSRLKSE